MSSRRLPLASAPELSSPPGWSGRLFVDGALLVVGDTGDGEAGLRWAGRLERELAQLGRRAAIVLPGIEAVTPPLRGLFSPGARLIELGPARLPASAAGLRALVEPAALAAATAPEPAGGTLVLLAGPLALPCFRGRLNVLVGADQPILRWPAALLPERGSFELELSGDGLAPVAALARALSDGWA